MSGAAPNPSGARVDHVAELPVRAHHHDERQAEGALEHRLDVAFQRCRRPVGLEQHVAGLDVGADCLVPGVLERSPQVGHAHDVLAAHVDSPQQRHIVRPRHGRDGSSPNARERSHMRLLGVSAPCGVAEFSDYGGRPVGTDRPTSGGRRDLSMTRVQHQCGNAKRGS